MNTEAFLLFGHQILSVISTVQRIVVLDYYGIKGTFQVKLYFLLWKYVYVCENTLKNKNVNTEIYLFHACKQKNVSSHWALEDE